MMALKSQYCLLLAAVASITGCGKQERSEAVQFVKVLTGTKANFASANTIEEDLVKNARAWCEGITANGAGRGVELDQNAAVAAELAKSAVVISSELSQVRQAIDGQPLKEEYPRQVRDILTTELTKRQRLLQVMHGLLEQSAIQFLESRHSKAYMGDKCPNGVAELDSLLRTHIAPDDALGAAIGALRAKYGLSGSEL